MSYLSTYKLINETYNGKFKINSQCHISDWQDFKKIYHFRKGFGIDLNKYFEINKKDLINLQKCEEGLINYVRKGNKLFPIELIRKRQQAIYDLCHHENTEVNYNAIHYHKKTGKTDIILYYNQASRQLAAFNKTTKDLLIADKYNQKYFDKCVNSGTIGNIPNSTNQKPDN